MTVKEILEIYVLIVLLVGAPTVFGGCGIDREAPSASEPVTVPAHDYSAFEDWVRHNPCGSLTIKRPLFNVSGQVSSSTGRVSMVTLFIAPNISPGAAVYVIEHCPPLMRIPLTEPGEFTLSSLPEGDYLVAFLGDPTTERPLPMEILGYHKSNYSISAVLTGEFKGSVYSVLSVRPLQGQQTRVENLQQAAEAVQEVSGSGPGLP